MQDKTPRNEQGQPDGYYETYYGNGRLSHKGLFVNGKSFGCHKNYWGDGSLWYEGNYINSERYGYYEDHWVQPIDKIYYAK
jgi:antitoxin component YwqK of YwqJK toxin-antitoxin module